MLSTLLLATLSVQPLPAAPTLPSQKSAPGDYSKMEVRLESKLEELRSSRGFPGASLAVVYAEDTTLAMAVGLSSREDETALTTDHRFLLGSTGKTFVTAELHRLVAAGKVDLDDPLTKYLGEEEWLDRVPNTAGINLRQLARHQTGIPRYVFEQKFWDALLAEPDKQWKPEEVLAFVFDRRAHFPPGRGIIYADTNYLLLGLALEKASGGKFYDNVIEHFIKPFGLENTVPSTSRTIEGMAQGYPVNTRRYGIAEHALEDGVFTYNPQFEWCGGGWATTPLDLARWAYILFGGRALEGDYLETMTDAMVATALGPGVRYGLGVMVRETTLGMSHGHDGFMPGYLTSMAYFPDYDMALAVQINTDDVRSVGPVHDILVDLALVAAPRAKQRPQK